MKPSFAKVRLRKTGRNLNRDSDGIDESDEPDGSCGIACSAPDLDFWGALRRLLACGYQTSDETGSRQRRAPPSAALAKLREGSGNVSPACPLCDRSVLSHERHLFRGITYHRACFVCFGCGTSLVHAGADLWRDGQPRCGACAERETVAARRRSITKGETAAEAGEARRPSHQGDVDGVLEEIGPELEVAPPSPISRIWSSIGWGGSHPIFWRGRPPPCRERSPHDRPSLRARPPPTARRRSAGWSPSARSAASHSSRRTSSS